MMLNKLKYLVCVSIMMSLSAICSGIPANPAEDPHVMIWYKLDETEGGTAHDGSMYGRDAVVDGPGNLGVWNPDDGQFGGSLVFNDNTDIEVPTDALSTISTGITVSVWLKDASRPGSNNWVFGTGSGSIRVTAAVVASNGSVLWRAGNSSNDQLSWDLDGLDHTTLNGWHHWVFVKDEVSGTINIYFDGSLAASKSGVDNTLVNVPGSQLRFGVGAGHANDFIGMMDDIRVYDLALTAGEVQLLYTGVFDVAVGPAPADKAEDIPRDGVILSWMPGASADKHDIYVGTNFNNVDNATHGDPVFQGTQSQNAYALDRLEFGHTYYWRIDEVNDLESSSPSKGEVWSFTTEPLAYPIVGGSITVTASSSMSDSARPQKTIDGSGLNDGDLHSTLLDDMWLSDLMGPQPTWIEFQFDKVYKLHELWIWNQNQQIENAIGYGFKDVSIEYSVDGIGYMPLGTGIEFAQAPGTPDYAHNTTVDFGGAAAKVVRLTANSNWGGLLDQYGLSEVRFFYIPVSAREPSPASGATDVDVNVTLGWRAGREAATHNMSLSTDEQAVIDGTAPAVTAAEASYSPLPLDLGNTYFWRIDEVNEAEMPATWQGDVWSFSTLEYLVVEDFEDYNNYPPNEIWNTWLDGYETPGNGATAGYPDSVVQAGGDYMERIIVHGGKQSMPLFYDNTGTASYSEVERTFSVAQDWTAHGARALTLYFRGRPFAFLQRVDGSILMSGAGVDIGEMADEFRFAYRQLNGNGSIVARVGSLANTHAWAKAGVMIRESLDIGSRFAALYITPGNGCRFQVRTATPANAIGDEAVATPEQIAISAPHWIKLERSGDAFRGFYSADGTAWTPMSWNPQTVSMQPNAYVGLAVTSHSTGNPTTAVFSEVVSTGNVTGQWQNAAIGVEQPSNDPARLYVSIEDSTGRVKTVVHPDDTTVGTDAWLPWQIPLSTFSSSDMDVTAVKKIRIGLGDRDNPTPGGGGLLYIDDIQLGRAPAELVSTIAHWRFNGTVGQEILTDTDIDGGYVVHKFYDASYGANAATDVFYGPPNPTYDTGGTSAEFMNDPGDNDPGVGLVIPDTGVDTLLDLSTLGAFTIETFIRPHTIGQSVIVRKYGGSPGQYYIDVKPDGDIHFSINADGNHAAAGSGAVVANEWYHVAAVFSETDLAAPMKIFINGELKGTAGFRTRPGDSPRGLGIGCIIRDNNNPPGNSGQFFNGRIDEVRFSAAALSIEEFLLNQ
ncbi:MAG: hypothetical protein JSW66_14005 [Phycisphaerales bacterium]|nr:MAG: hypothetical protein JSW66_14005 [Phycisphaerales bacterium]